MVVAYRLARLRRLSCFDEAEHLHQIVIPQLDGSFTSGTFNCLSRQVLIHKLNSHGPANTRALLNSHALEDLSHAPCTNRGIGGFYLIVDSLTLLLLTL